MEPCSKVVVYTSSKREALQDGLIIPVACFDQVLLSCENRPSGHLYAFEMHIVREISAKRFHFPFPDLVLHSNLQRSPMDKRENSAEKRELCFFHVFIKHLQIKIMLLDHNILYIILYNCSHCTPAAQSICQLLFPDLEMYTLLHHS